MNRIHVTFLVAGILAACSGDAEVSVKASDASDMQGSDTGSNIDPRDGGGTEDSANTGGDDSGTTVPDMTASADMEATLGSLSERYPGDNGISDDPAVLFHDDFENGWGRWDRPTGDTDYLTILSNASIANSGAGYLQSRVTTQDLAQDQYISSASRVGFDQVEELYWRFYARMPNVAPNPHHWVRVSAGDENWESSGLANTVPPGDQGFWFDFDINNNDVFNFYVYWHEMRSGRCNDGSATPGCEGDQGNTYYYGNVFRPPNQTPYPRDEWFCVEMRAKANTPGEYDGELTFWVEDALVGDYRPGNPEGTWLRATFHTDGCDFSACTEPQPFEGFNFRTEADVGFKAVILDAYYERDSSARKRDALEDRGLTVSDEQTIYYDDVVVATERIGCRTP